MGNSIASSSTGSSIPLGSPLGHAGRGPTTKKGNQLGVSDPAREGIHDLKVTLDVLTRVHAGESAMDHDGSSLSHSILRRLANRIPHDSPQSCEKSRRDAAARGLDTSDLYRLALLSTTRADNVSTLTGEDSEEETLEDRDSMSRMDEIESYVRALLDNEEGSSRQSSRFAY